MMRIAQLYVMYGLLKSCCAVAFAFRSGCRKTPFPAVAPVRARARTVLGPTNQHASQQDVDLTSSLPEPSDSTFGRRDYWDDLYRKANDGQEFSWYSDWDDLEPFVRELVPDGSSRVLIPGIGNDGAIVGMYDSGYQNLTAFDYAPEGVNCARQLLGETRLRSSNDTDSEGVDLWVADGRDLPFENGKFDAAFDKGTLDAIYLSGGHDKQKSVKHLQMAVSELDRVVRPGGVVVSVTAACVAAVQAAFDAGPTKWRMLRDGDIYITEDGYASNNIDGTLLAWERLPKE